MNNNMLGLEAAIFFIASLSVVLMVAPSRAAKSTWRRALGASGFCALLTGQGLGMLLGSDMVQKSGVDLLMMLLSLVLIAVAPVVLMIGLVLVLMGVILYVSELRTGGNADA